MAFEGGVRRPPIMPNRTRPTWAIPNAEWMKAPLRAPAPRSGGAAIQLRSGIEPGQIVGAPAYLTVKIPFMPAMKCAGKLQMYA